MPELYAIISNSKTPDGLVYRIHSSEEASIELDFAYDTVQVFRGEKWVFYDKKDFAPNQGTSVVIDKGGPTKIEAKILSARMVLEKQDGIVLYEHINYCGNQKVYQDECYDINKDFPSNTVPGASSAIVWPTKTWRLYTKVGFEGNSRDFKPGAEYPTFVPLGLNDKIQSLKTIMPELYAIISNSKTPGGLERRICTPEVPIIELDFAYDTVQVFRGEKWVFYDKKDFAPNQGTSIVIDKGPPTKINATIHSARMVLEKQDGIVLYEHINYCGNQKVYQDECYDINKDFPSNTVPGASSAIVWPTKTWRLYTKVGFEGNSRDFQPGAEYPTFVPLGLNDKIQSLKTMPEPYVTISSSKNGKEYEIYNYEDANIELDFAYDTVQVFRGEKWVFYDKKDFAPNGGTSIVIDKGRHTKIKAKILSARMVLEKQDGIVLYEHINYCGNQKVYQDECYDINKDFPSNTVPGASSAIVWPTKTWRLYTKVGFEGSSLDFQTGHEYPNFVCLGINDKIQSLKSL